MTKHKIHEEHKLEKKWDTTTKVLAIVVGVLLLFLIYNGFKISGLSKQTTSGDAGLAGSNAFASIIPTGAPAIYGQELGVLYDDVSVSNQRKADATINKLGALDNQITLEGTDLERYISIASKISCEYCCGAASVIFPNGQAACGCAHSYAMRGVAKYLIKNHASEFSDDQILEEMGKWKVLFFPDIHMQKAAALQASGIEVNYITLASNMYRQ